MYIKSEDLWIVQLSEQLGDKIHVIAKSWDFGTKKTLGQQIQRSADSVGANIVEGCGRQHNLETLKFLYIARASLNETQFWLRRAAQRNLITKETARDLFMGYAQLGKGLNSLINFRRRSQSPNHRITQ